MFNQIITKNNPFQKTFVFKILLRGFIPDQKGPRWENTLNGRGYGRKIPIWSQIQAKLQLKSESE